MTKMLHLTGKMFALNLAAVREHRERKNYRRLPADCWSHLPEQVFQQHKPVFFLSTGRCGTQLLTNILTKEKEILCHHTPQPQLLFLGRKAYEEGREQFEAYKIAVLAARFELISDCMVRQRRYVETNCHATFFAPHIAALFPQARFVHLVRHPGEFIRSGVRRKYYQGSYDDIGRIRPCQGKAADEWQTLDAFQRCAWLWNETNAFIEEAKSGMKPHQVLTVHSEQLFTDPEVLIGIYEHCGFPSPTLSWASSQIKRKVNEQQARNGVPHHSSWDKDLCQRVRRWIPLATQYGHEL